MKYFRTISCIGIFMVLFFFGAHHAWAQQPSPPEEPTPVEQPTPPEEPATFDLVGTLMDANGEPIPSAMVTITHDTKTKTVRKAVSNKDGQFRLQAVRPGVVSITFEGAGYTTMEEQGITLAEGMDLSRTLQEKTVGGWWLMLLLIPGVSGLGVAALKERRLGERTKAVAKKATAGLERDIEPSPQGEEAGGGGPESNPIVDTNKFDVAVVNGLIWLVTMGLLAWLGGLGSQGVYRLQLFHPSLSFDFYIPILGFVGALLYVLDLFRRSGEGFPKGTEFGMRLVMGPYVAIVMVVLFGNDLGFVNLASPIAQGVLAFFSGLLVVVALQGLTEKGNEVLGKWRQKSRYESSEIAEKFGLNQEEDLTLQRAGIRLLAQLRERRDDILKIDVRKVGFDENLATSFKKELEKEQLGKAIGGLVWERLKRIHVDMIEDLAHLEKAGLEKISEEDPKLNLEHLIALRDQASELCKPQ